MPQETPNYQLPYPEPGDPSTTWVYWENLAKKLDEDVLPTMGGVFKIYPLPDKPAPQPGVLIPYIEDQGDRWQPMFMGPDGIERPHGESYAHQP